MSRLEGAHTWVFDLDNTLYPADTRIMEQVDRRMTEFVMDLLDLPSDEARAVQKRYWREYGTTLNGLIQNHDLDRKAFLDFVHDVDHSAITPDPDLARHIAALDGRRIVYTNGSRGHAEKVVARLGLDGLFEDLFDIEAADFNPKPHRAGFETFTGRLSIKPEGTVMFEDSLRNLETAHAMGFTTVLVRASWLDDEGETAGPDCDADHIHFACDSLKGFLGDLTCGDAGTSEA